MSGPFDFPYYEEEEQLTNQEIRGFGTSFGTIFGAGTVELPAQAEVLFLSTSVIASATAQAELSVVQQLSATCTTEAQATGALTLVQFLSASVTTESTTSAVLSLVIPPVVSLAASVTTESTIVANLTGILLLDASITSTASASAAISGMANATLGELVVLQTNTATISETDVDVQGMLKALNIRRNRKKTGYTQYKVCMVYQGISP